MALNKGCLSKLFPRKKIRKKVLVDKENVRKRNKPVKTNYKIKSNE